jgi:division protein CdvB (Snf7/Vps24/ESCRT-III family)
VEFLRQFWLTYLSPTKSPAKKKELEGLAQSLKRTQERMETVRVYAVKEGGDAMGRRVLEVLGSVAGSVKKAIRLWERP